MNTKVMRLPNLRLLQMKIGNDVHCYERMQHRWILTGLAPVVESTVDVLLVNHDGTKEFSGSWEDFAHD